MYSPALATSSFLITPLCKGHDRHLSGVTAGHRASNDSSSEVAPLPVGPMPGGSLPSFLRTGLVPGGFQRLDHKEPHSGNGHSPLSVCWAAWAERSLRVCGVTVRAQNPLPLYLLTILRVLSLGLGTKLLAGCRCWLPLCLSVIGPVAWATHGSSLGLSLSYGTMK